jgi:hypothetical protein
MIALNPSQMIQRSKLEFHGLPYQYGFLSQEIPTILSLLQPYMNQSYNLEHKKGREYTHKNKRSNTTLERGSQKHKHKCLNKTARSSARISLESSSSGRVSELCTLLECLKLCMLLECLSAERGRHRSAFIAPEDLIVDAPSMQKDAINQLPVGTPDRSGVRVHVPRV